MFNWNLMSARDRKVFKKICEVLPSLKVRHKELCKKAAAKTITKEENLELRQLIKAYNELEKLKNNIWQSNSLINMLVEK